VHWGVLDQLDLPVGKVGPVDSKQQKPDLTGLLKIVYYMYDTFPAGLPAGELDPTGESREANPPKVWEYYSPDKIVWQSQ
jgi:hypothetical protein